MAAEAGAALDATISFETDFQPISWEVSDVETLRNFVSRNGGKLIWLDAKGRRFARETGYDSQNARHGLFHRVYYIVFDENIKQDVVKNKATSGPGGAQFYDDLDKQFQKQANSSINKGGFAAPVLIQILLINLFQ